MALRTLSEIAQELGINYNTAYGWMRAEVIEPPQVTLGRRHFYTAQQQERIRRNEYVRFFRESQARKRGDT